MKLKVGDVVYRRSSCWFGSYDAWSKETVKKVTEARAYTDEGSSKVMNLDGRGRGKQ
jgi:hypothetical protein